MFLSSNLNLTPAKDYEAPEECKELLKLLAMPPPKRRKRGEAAEEGHEEEGDEEDDDGSCRGASGWVFCTTMFIHVVFWLQV